MATSKKKKHKSKSSKAFVSLTNTEAQNAAKTLLANIRFLSVDNPIRSIALTSSVPNEGKTTVSIYLAFAIATAGHRVLLVEADMRRRSAARALNVQSKSGMYAVLTGAVPFQQALVKVPAGNIATVDFLDVEPGIPNPADILASKRFARLLDELHNTYEYIIFDTPPVGTFVDAAVLSAIIDATILVVRPGHVKRELMLGAYDQLLKSGGNVIGAVANFVEENKSEYYYAYYNEEGKRVGSSDSMTFPAAPPSNLRTSPASRQQSAPQNAPMGTRGTSASSEPSQARDPNQIRYASASTSATSDPLPSSARNEAKGGSRSAGARADGLGDRKPRFGK